MAIIGFHAAHEQIGPAQLLTVPLTIAGEQEGSTLLDLLHDGTTTIGDGGTVELELEGYGFRWLRLHREDDGIDRLPNVSTVDVRPNRKK
jgi:hypothetical protein